MRVFTKDDLITLQSNIMPEEFVILLALMDGADHTQETLADTTGLDLATIQVSLFRLTKSYGSPTTEEKANAFVVGNPIEYVKINWESIDSVITPKYLD